MSRVKSSLGMLVIMLLMAAVIFTNIKPQPVEAQKAIEVFKNVRIENALFTDGKWSGEKTWAITGTKDTLLVTNVDTTCIVFLSEKNTVISWLKYDMGIYGDTVFVFSDSSEVADSAKYAWEVIHGNTGATN